MEVVDPENRVSVQRSKGGVSDYSTKSLDQSISNPTGSSLRRSGKTNSIASVSSAMSTASEAISYNMDVFFHSLSLVSPDVWILYCLNSHTYMLDCAFHNYEEVEMPKDEEMLECGWSLINKVGKVLYGCAYFFVCCFPSTHIAREVVISSK